MLGLVVRVAQRMGIDKESANIKHNALEAEMRRRLWWGIATFDNRFGELSECPPATLSPLWDCTIPLNVQDLEIMPGMTAPIAGHDAPTEAIFAVLRSELGNFIRHSEFHLDFHNPTLKVIARSTRIGLLARDDLDAFEKRMQDKYLRQCNAENPLHFMAMWSMRGQLAKHRLLEHFSRHSEPSPRCTEEERDAATGYAIGMLECDTRLVNSPLCKNFFWYAQYNLPFPAYIHIVKDLRNRPGQSQVASAWKAMEDNYRARFMDIAPNEGPMLSVFSKNIVQAWDASTARLGNWHQAPETISIVVESRQRLSKTTSSSSSVDSAQSFDVSAMNVDDLASFFPMQYNFNDSFYDTEAQNATWSSASPADLTQATLNMNLDQSSWATVPQNTGSFFD